MTLSRNLKRKSLAIALSLKAKDKKLVVVSDIAKISKTKDAATLLSKMDQTKRFTIALADKNKESARIFRNIDNVTVLPFTSLNAYSIYRGGTIVVDKDVFEKGTKAKTK